MSRDLKTDAPRPIAKRWDGPGGAILVDIKRTHGMRDLRDALVSLAYLLQGEPSASQAVCLLLGSRLSFDRLTLELHQLRGVLLPQVADRLHFLVGTNAPGARGNAFHGSLHGAPAEFYSWLNDQVAREREGSPTPQLPPRQAVVATLAQLRLWNHAPVTIKYLQQTCRVSYPTAAAVLKELTDKGLLEDNGPRGIRMRHLAAGEWMALARDHARLRTVFLFIDPARHASPRHMAQRLVRCQDSGKLPRRIRIGGVLGGYKHFPDLDISAAPRLDLCVEADPLSVARVLDAGLVPKTKPEQAVALAVHVTLGMESVPTSGPQAQEPWAGEFECLTDLIEMGYEREASEMAAHLARANKEGDISAGSQ